MSAMHWDTIGNPKSKEFSPKEIKFLFLVSRTYSLRLCSSNPLWLFSPRMVANRNGSGRRPSKQCAHREEDQVQATALVPWWRAPSSKRSAPTPGFTSRHFLLDADMQSLEVGTIQEGFSESQD